MLVRLIAPLVVFVALKVPTALTPAPLRVVPVADVVVRVPVVLTRPLPDSVIVLPAVRSTAPEYC